MSVFLWCDVNTLLFFGHNGSMKKSKVNVDGYQKASGTRVAAHISSRYKKDPDAEPLNEKNLSSAQPFLRHATELLGKLDDDYDKMNVLITMRNALEEIIGEVPPEAIGSLDSTGDKTADEIMFALDSRTAKWSQEGFGFDSDWEDWEALDFSPEEAGAWRRADVSLARATTWKAFSPDDFEEWEAVSKLTPHRYGIVSSLADWRRMGCSPDEALYAQQLYMYPRDAKPFKELGNLREVHSLSKEKNLSASDIKQWIQAGVPVGDIATWIDKGYTLPKAKRQITAGVKVEKVKDLKQGEILISPAWKKIQQSLKDNKWRQSEINEKSERFTRSGKVVAVRVHKGTEDVVLLFKPSGQFMRMVHPVSQRTIAKTQKEVMDYLSE